MVLAAIPALPAETAKIVHRLDRSPFGGRPTWSFLWLLALAGVSTGALGLAIRRLTGLLRKQILNRSGMVAPFWSVLVFAAIDLLALALVWFAGRIWLGALFSGRLPDLVRRAGPRLDRGCRDSSLRGGHLAEASRHGSETCATYPKRRDPPSPRHRHDRCARRGKPSLGGHDARHRHDPGSSAGQRHPRAQTPPLTLAIRYRRPFAAWLSGLAGRQIQTGDAPSVSYVRLWLSISTPFIALFAVTRIYAALSGGRRSRGEQSSRFS